MKKAVLKEKKCKNCKLSYLPKMPLQQVCSVACGYNLVRKQKAKKEKKDIGEIKKSLLTHKDYIQLLQKVVNTYVRLRDKDCGCISCDKPLNTKYDAGHFYPTTYQFLRFHEDNIHGQCVRCNRDLHGNTHEYTKRLEVKIGFDRLQKLHNDRHKRLEMSIPEIQEKIKYYKKKIAELK